jgi:hypothetical protein
MTGLDREMVRYKKSNAGASLLCYLFAGKGNKLWELKCPAL